MKISLTLLSLTVFLSAFSQNSENLIPVPIDGKFGYINTKGGLIIEPQYLSAGEFQSGLACVRKHGTFGFINTKGELVIPYQFDKEATFEEGFASVQKLGESILIDSLGESYFDNCGFKHIRKIPHEELFIVSTTSGNYGLINKSCSFLIDTSTASIEYVVGNRLMIQKNHNEWGSDENVYKIVDYKGNTIGLLKDFEYIKYDESSKQFSANKFFYSDSIDSVFTIDGTLSYIQKRKTSEFQKHTEAKNGNVIIKNSPLVDDKIWFGALNHKNEVLFKDSTFIDLQFITDNLLLGQKMDSTYILLDTLGRAKMKQKVSEFIPYDFTFLRTKNEHILAIIRFEEKWHYLFANESIEPLPEFMHQEKIASLDYQGFFVQKNTSNSYNFYSFRTQNLLPSALTSTVITECNQGIFSLFSNDSVVLINQDHDEIYRYSQKLPKTNNFLSLKYTVHYIINNESWEKLSAADKSDYYTGYCISKPFVTFKRKNTKTFFVHIDTTKALKDQFARRYRPLQVVNASNEPVLLSKIDGYLDLRIEAIDPFGNWLTIQIPYPSTCGNSYRQSELPPKEMYALSIPVYEGELKTKIRAVVKIYDEEQSKTVEVYSNEIDGFVNPGQFYNLPNPYWDLDEEN